MSVTPHETARNNDRAEVERVLDFLAWARDFGLTEAYIDDETGQFYYRPVTEPCDEQHCTPACGKPRQSLWGRLTGLLRG